MKAAALDHRLWYTASNEDGASEIAALAPVGRHVLSITASGSRTFDLLTADPASIVSIDQNPAQTALAELLAEGYRRLPYPRFCALVGTEDAGGTRAQDFERLTTALSPEARAFWQRNARMIDTGLIYAGRWEGFLRTMHRLAGRRRAALARRLLAAATLEEQYGLWRDEWDDRGWRMLLRLMSVRWLWRHVAREPGIAFVAPDFDIADYVAARLDHAARHIRFAESPFAWLMLTGAYPREVRPRYLSEGAFPNIASRIERVLFVTAPVQDYVASAPADIFEAVSLSDYSSYCDIDMQRVFWAELSRAVAPRGRVCERKFFNKLGTELPEEIGFVRDHGAEETLTAADRAFFYSFVVAERG
jgi:S-adenosylmethionine-diacylglycerol 3-amino-3-carboxypropyl transferase